MFLNSKMYDSGAVGIALSDGSFGVESTYFGYKSLSDKLSITECQGNIIKSFDEKSASKSLLNSIYGSGIMKTKLYARVTSGNSHEVYRIIAVPVD
jgi:small ligand-binding sensory domain FIST